ncbi:hypothetical protein GCM10028895_20550 [Pontibacter rugosus]
MRRAVKKAGLQNPVLTNRKYIRGRKSWVSKHPFATPLANKRLCVDAAGIGGRKVLLPGEVSRCRARREKSAEAIVVIWKRAVSATEVSQGDEGLNVKLP